MKNPVNEQMCSIAAMEPDCERICAGRRNPCQEEKNLKGRQSMSKIKGVIAAGDEDSAR